MKTMTTIAIWVTFLSGLIAALFVLGIFASARSAPQEASAAATALCFSVIPYVFLRVFQIAEQRTAEQERHTEIIEQLASIARSLERKQ